MLIKPVSKECYIEVRLVAIQVSPMTCEIPGLVVDGRMMLDFDLWTCFQSGGLGAKRGFNLGRGY